MADTRSFDAGSRGTSGKITLSKNTFPAEKLRQ
jgi:hypothetical protein